MAAVAMPQAYLKLHKAFISAPPSLAPARAARRLPLQHCRASLPSARDAIKEAIRAAPLARCEARSRDAAPQPVPPTIASDVPSNMLMLAALLTPLLLDAEPASANQLLAGRTASLVHPTVMVSLLLVSLYTGWLGFNYRQARLIPAEVRELKQQLPSDEEAKAASPVQSQIKELESKRKDLLKGDPRSKHFLWSSLLLGMGTTFAVVGPVNTYLRAGKLFPGPHLYAGALMVVLWGIAASMVPLMSRNNDLARNVHIGANVVNTGLFLWQMPTGIEIVLKVFEFTSWP